ncbi:MAG TPA: hypothetical protein VD902_22200 [Symbiobacteriaceae bacterium]|nr:hypothetical protein [Symbiobacteriaceae bacterium]
MVNYTKFRATTPLVLACVALVAWFGVARFSYREADPLLTDVDNQRPGTVQFVEGYWVARLSTGEYRTYLNQEPHSGLPLRWYDDDEELHVKWDFLWNGGSFITRVSTPKAHFTSPVYGELYTIDGKCVAGPCDERGLYVVPTKIQDKQLRIAPGSISQAKDMNTPGQEPQPEGQAVPVTIEVRDRWRALRNLAGAIVTVGDLRVVTGENGASLSLVPGNYTYSVVLTGVEYRIYGKLCVPQGPKTIGFAVNYNRRADEMIDLCGSPSPAPR